jgi:hypothetical protein
MILNLQNVEDLVFFDKKVWDTLPEFRPLFEQWALSKRVPGMQNLGKRSLIDFLNSLEKSHLDKLEEYFHDIIVLDKIDYHTVQNYNGKIDEIQSELCRFEGFVDFSAYRKGDQISLTFWK